MWVYRCCCITFVNVVVFGQGVVIRVIINSHLLVTVKQDWPERVKIISSPERKRLAAMNSLQPLEKDPFG